MKVEIDKPVRSKTAKSVLCHFVCCVTESTVFLERLKKIAKAWNIQCLGSVCMHVNVYVGGGCIVLMGSFQFCNIRGDSILICVSYCCRKEKPTDETDGPSPLKKTKSSKEDAAIKGQSKLMYKYRDQLKKELRKSDLQDLLEHNDQDVPVGEDRVCIQFSAQACV